MASFYARSTGIFGSGGGGSATSYKQESLTGTFAAGNTTYTLSQTPSDSQAVVAVLGAVPQGVGAGLDCTISGATITFTGVNTSAQNLLVIYPY